jgi:hypothetical protein
MGLSAMDRDTAVVHQVGLQLSSSGVGFETALAGKYVKVDQELN